jgi:hypothetical protein
LLQEWCFWDQLANTLLAKIKDIVHEVYSTYLSNIKAKRQARSDTQQELEIQSIQEPADYSLSNSQHYTIKTQNRDDSLA